MATILDKIVADTRRTLADRMQAVPERVLRDRLASAPPVRDFAAALRGPGVSVIAEFKRASPSQGVIREGADPAGIARLYAAGGAAAMSVLTEPDHFRGSLDDLAAVRAAVDLPVLRKDFIVEAYQLLEARAAGANAVLLIAAILDDDDLQHLLGEAHMLDLAPLVEVHNQAELDRVLATDAAVIGINNRDLTTFTVDLATSERLVTANDLTDRVVVSESGIATADDISRLARAGVDAVLVGTTLMRADDPGVALRDLLGGRS